MIDARSARRLGSALRSGVRGARERPLLFALSVATMGGGLLVLALYLLVVANLRGVLERVGSDLRLVAFVDVHGAEVETLNRDLRHLPGVGRLRFVPPAEALARLREDLGKDAEVLDGLGQNPLPGSFEVSLGAGHRSPEELRALASAIQALPGISEVRYGEAWVEGYARVVRLADWLGLALGGFLVLVLGAIVAGTIRLSLHARADEIAIQRLVGAGGLFVRMPFYLEGALQGALAAGVALAVLRGLYALGLPFLAEAMAWLVGRVPLVFLGAFESGALVVLGVALGLGGALVSLLHLDEAP